MKIISLDTSGLVCTVAVTEDDRLLSEFSIQHKITHSELLLPMMEQIKERLSLDLNTVDAIAVSAGPGSFTGLRIGVATAKGLCLALNKPLIAVPTLDALAYNLYGNENIICPMMDARRSQVYTGIYTFVPEKESEDQHEVFYKMKTLMPQAAMSVAEIADRLNKIGKRAVLLGDGIPVYRDKLDDLLKVDYILAPPLANRQRAAALSVLAAEYFRKGKLADTDSFAPEYLRASQAEREAKEKKARTVKIREMSAEDITESAALEAASLGKEAWTEKQLLEACTRDDTVYIVAEKAGRVAGLCGVRNISGEGDVTNVSVSAELRNTGIGYMMLTELLKKAEGIGCRDFTLEVREQNQPARKLYEKLGFVNEGIRPNFYDDPDDNAVIYWKRNTND
ncbi:tRNA (adenosine(37)-N6)-threonylcarbamoyltransferase complex dimerization subunit type 1 TsaB [Butyrivibrio sp. WCD3002]|uniref:tRNA (adenosine(37)-N6)-threonylcarbamoyltransferase complex dimerization subunit type 1 TsaB n=1 Tax=Butyrivibrio sp. WCD3002 TaxID=1280676 RepID=UPI00041F12C5|nr:tRNA (adenosine(37)-N6)-threonylcarbamoyltransferase complex dimerization subunit type 1 TsaB [Butyrivibrio sp. WCD3002]